MKKCISASSALLAAAMMVTLSFGCGEGIEGETGSQSAQLNKGRSQSARLIKGQCNAIIARSLGFLQQCNRVGCNEEECNELVVTFEEFFATAGCAQALADGKLNGLPGNALSKPNGEPKHLQEVFCGANYACDTTCARLRGAGLCSDTVACNE